MQSGGGTRATKRAERGGRQRPDLDARWRRRPSRDAHQARLGGRGVRERVQPVGGRGPGGAHEARRRASVSWWLSGWPERCAPTTAIGIGLRR